MQKSLMSGASEEDLELVDDVKLEVHHMNNLPADIRKRFTSDIGLARNGAGLKVVSEISLRKELFCRDTFPEAMVVYMHELLHQFGGNASRQFRTAILAMNYRIMESPRRLEVYEKEWVELTIKN